MIWPMRPASTIWEEKAKSNYNTDQTRDGPESELEIYLQA